MMPKSDRMQALIFMIVVGLWMSVPQILFYKFMGVTAPYSVAVGPLTIVWFVINLLLGCIYMILWGCDD